MEHEFVEDFEESDLEDFGSLDEFSEEDSEEEDSDDEGVSSKAKGKRKANSKPPSKKPKKQRMSFCFPPSLVLTLLFKAASRSSTKWKTRRRQRRKRLRGSQSRSAFMLLVFCLHSGQIALWMLDFENAGATTYDHQEALPQP